MLDLCRDRRLCKLSPGEKGRDFYARFERSRTQGLLHLFVAADRRRMKAVSVTTFFIVFIYFPLTFCSRSDEKLGGVSPRVFTSYLYLTFLPPTPLPLFHTMLLFLGPLSNLILSASQLLKTASPTRGWKLRQALHHVLVEEHNMPDTIDLRKWSIDSLRNLVIAPFTEELIYRSSLIPYLLQLGFKPVHVGESESMTMRMLFVRNRILNIF